MFSSSTSAIFTLAVVVSMIQPCPAPPLLLLPAIGVVADAGIAAGGVAAVGAGVGEGAAAAAEAGAEAGAGAAAGAKFRRRRDAASNQIQTQFSACMGDALKVDKPTVLINPDHTAIVNGLPPSCMAQIKDYNAHPDIAALEAAHGSTKIMNSTAVYLSGIPNAFDSYLESIAKKNH